MTEKERPPTYSLLRGLVVTYTHLHITYHCIRQERIHSGLHRPFGWIADSTFPSVPFGEGEGMRGRKRVKREGERRLSRYVARWLEDDAEEAPTGLEISCKTSSSVKPLLYRGLVAVQSRFSRGSFQTTPIASALGSMCSTFCQSPPFFGLEDTTQHEVCFSAAGTSVFARVRPS